MLQRSFIVKMMDLNDLHFHKFKCKHLIQLLSGGYSGILDEREGGLKLPSIPRNEERETQRKIWGRVKRRDC